MLTPLLAMLLARHAELPVVVVDRDNVRLAESCIVRIPQDAIIPDADGDGVIHVAADNITIRFEPGAVLRGARVGDSTGLAPWDTLTGIGIRSDGFKGVKILGAAVAGYKVGLYASNCDGLAIEDARFDDNFRQRLGSTPQREDAGDWLWPHENDQHQWMDRYGGAVVVERAGGVLLRGVRVRTGQNGIILDRVERSRIVDCDASFLSGWGLALWRSSDNLISRNAFDFCVRGYSHDVYNRGQDSAGILCFEACKRNSFIENSLTHGGDGFFGFGGKESLGETPPPPSEPDFDYAAAGCAENVFVGNDLSHAVAHGLEHTFSDRCLVLENRIVDNAICGIWGGYSNSWTIQDNTFEANGAMGYGLERGAINIEHGGGHLIRRNTFVNNRVALHLWWDDDKGLLATPGVKARYMGPTGNEFSHNLVRIDRHHPFAWVGGKPPPLTVLQVRDTDGSHAKDNTYNANMVELAADGAQELDLSQGISLVTDAAERPPATGEWKAEGLTRPVGARASLRGRQNIIMGEWGPWDHESPMMRYVGPGPDADRWQVFGDTRAAVTASDAVDTRVWKRDGLIEVDCVPRGEGLCHYTLSVDALGTRWARQHSMLRTTWRCTAFPSPGDPRQDLEAWRAAAESGTGFQLRGDLNLPLGGGGLRGVPGLGVERDRLPGGSHYGIVATTDLQLPPGEWTVRTTSDDGVRVRVRIDSGTPRTVIENWTHHAPAQDSGSFDLAAPARVHLEVEYFQLDGHAVLRLELLPGR